MSQNKYYLIPRILHVNYPHKHSWDCHRIKAKPSQIAKGLVSTLNLQSRGKTSEVSLGVTERWEKQVCLSNFDYWSSNSLGFFQPWSSIFRNESDSAYYLNWASDVFPWIWHHLYNFPVLFPSWLAFIASDLSSAISSKPWASYYWY